MSCHNRLNVCKDRSPITKWRMPGALVFKAVQNQTLFFLADIGLELIDLSSLGNLIVLIRDRSGGLSNPIDAAVMGDARDALNGSKAHPVEGHFDAESLHFGAVSLRLRMLAELAAAVAAQIALSALASDCSYSLVVLPCLGLCLTFCRRLDSPNCLCSMALSALHFSHWGWSVPRPSPS